MQIFLVIPVGLLILLRATIGSAKPITQPAHHLTPNPADPTPDRFTPNHHDCDCHHPHKPCC
ncbi:hypothetical protein PTTG_25353 [Puccinia triticina 1-1 BBBD Race 1]|uniref:Uncharacterized protein n=1 Tax=Puccinia triticina (isolate 1-1 / race 1 (BBBD)) TaxID=630390 RepID=A0A180H2U8_PUCT1|nr:hypothetical protein PTTG_25353 [Puccinia triticina 1-1 BBBD Race 1]